MILKKAKDRERYLRSRKFKSTPPENKKDIQIMIKSRVWEKFLTRVGIALLLCVGGFSWIMLVFQGLIYFGVSAETNLILGPLIAIVLPSAIMMLRSVFNNCKAEVEKENKDLMEMIGDNR